MTRHTIFALATPPAKSGVAIIRISGPGARGALEQLTGKSDWQPNVATLCAIRHPSSGAIIDHGLCLYFKAPKSFTGEDIAELHVHGSLAVIRELLGALAGVGGLSPAEPGEFTRRAFLNGKMDLTQAEGLADLIDAETTTQKTQALRQMEGALSERYNDMRRQITTALALLEAYIDFPEEEIPESVIADTKTRIAELSRLIAETLADEGRGERLREGLHIVILGAPNVGKSSLLNCLAGRDAAIVSSRAGTTRDVIEIHMDIAGFPVILTDTAGLRETQDDIEEEGIKRALGRAGQADLKLAIFEAGSPEDAATKTQIDSNTLIIINKIDISPPKPITHNLHPAISISTQTGQGIDALLAAIEARVSSIFSGAATPLITRSRHRAHLSECLACLTRLDFTAPLELTCEELRLSARALGKITGNIAVDDVLDVIFKQFCIGK